jgi:hypothetical protein
LERFWSGLRESLSLRSRGTNSVVFVDLIGLVERLFADQVLEEGIAALLGPPRFRLSVHP